MSLVAAVQAMRKHTEERGGASLLTHTPDGGTLIYVGPNELDVTAMLVSAIAEIESKRGEPCDTAG
ncbi:hypothetical protein [Vreelandella venusta]|uniref:hypothetical protein n=1 Tax=Vreelandella venusta TaxID=44935 RepID=UPI003F6786F3